MSQRELSVALSDQHLKRLSQCPPIEAISELIWNSLDAGSTNIWVDIHKTTTDGVEKIIIEDNGNGIESQTLDNAFGSLGLSPKSISNTNSRGKVVHGKLGEGRFRAYSLGNRVEWLSKDKSKKIVKIKGELEKPRSFFIEPSAEKIKSTSGTKFTAYNGYGDKLRIPSTEAVVNKLIGIFAPKLLSRFFVNQTFDAIV